MLLILLKIQIALCHPGNYMTKPEVAKLGTFTLGALNQGR